jgi:hypothetical protein
MLPRRYWLASCLSWLEWLIDLSEFILSSSLSLLFFRGLFNNTPRTKGCTAPNNRMNVERSGYFFENFRSGWKSSVKILSTPFEIWTGHILTTSWMLHHKCYLFRSVRSVEWWRIAPMLTFYATVKIIAPIRLHAAVLMRWLPQLCLQYI